MYPGYEEIDYEIIGGMVFMELSMNLVHTLLPLSPSLIKYADTREQMKPAVILTHIMPDSVALRTRVIGRPGIIVKEINGKKIGTLADLREALRISLDTKTLTLRTTEEQFAVYPFIRMLAEEEKLSQTYFYPITKTVRELIEAISKKEGPLSTRIIRGKDTRPDATNKMFEEAARVVEEKSSKVLEVPASLLPEQTEQTQNIPA